MPSLVEDGFKSVRGRLTEGRYLTFETSGLALANPNGSVVAMSAATKDHEVIEQRWIIHAVRNVADTFLLQSAIDKAYIGRWPTIGSLVQDATKAQPFVITYHANSTSYSLQPSKPKHSHSHSKKYISSRLQSRTHTNGSSPVEWGASGGQLKIFSVSYRS